MLPLPAVLLPPTTALQALARARERIEAVPRAEVMTVNLDVPRTVTTVLAAAERAHGFASAIARLPDSPDDLAGRLRDGALALLLTHVDASRRPRTLATLASLRTRATVQRERLLRVLRAMVQRGTLPRDGIDSFADGPSGLELAADLVRLDALVREAWPAVARDGRLELDDLHGAAVIAAELHAAIDQRRLGSPPEPGCATARLARDRAFTRLVRDHDDLRRAITFLRWPYGDAEALAPSLYRKRTRPRDRARARPRAAQRQSSSSQRTAVTGRGAGPAGLAIGCTTGPSQLPTIACSGSATQAAEATSSDGDARVEENAGQVSMILITVATRCE